MLPRCHFISGSFLAITTVIAAVIAQVDHKEEKRQ
jgi:hypothetical protein